MIKWTVLVGQLCFTKNSYLIELIGIFYKREHDMLDKMRTDEHTNEWIVSSSYFCQAVNSLCETITEKYTNPARGILDFCKQKFYRPLLCSPWTLYSMYTQFADWILPGTRKRSLYKLKPPPPLHTEMLWEKFNSRSYSHKPTHYYFVNQTIANYQAQKGPCWKCLYQRIIWRVCPLPKVSPPAQDLSSNELRPLRPSATIIWTLHYIASD